MKIACPKCHSAYRIDLPNPGEAGIDVQCGNCLHIFLFSPGIEKPRSPKIRRGASAKAWDSNLPEDRSTAPIVPPQKDEDQEVSVPKKQPFSLPVKDQEPPLEAPLDDSEPIEIVVEDKHDDSLEKEALDYIWNQAVQEGARKLGKSKEKSPLPLIKKPVETTIDEEKPEPLPPLSPPPLPVKQSKSLPSLEDRQREINQIIADHQSEQEIPGGKPQPPATQPSQPKEKIQEEIDLEEKVIISENEKEAIPSWEEAFTHQSKVEDGWRKAQAEDRIHEEQQLADALGEQYVTPEPSAEKTAPTDSPEGKQSLVDEIFAKAKDSQKSPIETADTPQTKSREGQNQDEIDPDEQAASNEEEAMPSWEEAFTHQSEAEVEWWKAQAEDRILEEQQLADALGEQYIPSEPSAEETSSQETQDSKQYLVDQLFTEVRSQQETAEQPEEKTQDEPLEESDEKAPSSEVKETHVGQHTIPGEIDLMTDLDDLNMKQLVTQAFKEESESQENIELPAPAPPLMESEETHEPELTVEPIAETPHEAEPPPAEAIPPLEMEPIPELTHESAEEEAEIPPLEMEVEPELTLESPEATVPPVLDETEELPIEATETPEEEEPTITEPLLDIEPEPAVESYEATVPPVLDEAMESLLENAETPAEEEPAITEPLLDIEPEPAVESYEATVPPVLDEAMESLLESAESSTEEEAEIPPLEMGVEPELTIESPEATVPPPALDEARESLLESAETPEEEEPTITEPLLDIEPEPAVESYEATEPSATQPAIVQEDFLDEDNLDIWADLLPEPNNEEEQVVDEEAAITLTEEEEPFEGADFWDQVLEKNSQETQTDKTEVELQPVSSAPVVQDTVERETLTDEELWKQAFPGEAELEPVASQSSEVGEEVSPSEVPPLIIGANVKPNEDEESEESLEYGEEAYEDFDDDDDEFEYQQRKRKLGPFTIPHGKRGDLVISGVMVVFLLLAGGIYFTMQTFAPDELTDIQTAETEIPEGLTPREVPLDKLAGDLASSKPEKTPLGDTPGDKGEAILSDPAKILEESPEEKGILKDLAESQILKDTGKTQTARIDQSALQALTGHSVTMSTIMPVAYNPTDIRVLSFSVEIQLSDAQSAKRVRESLPVYEEIMNQAVEEFLRRKFYNDILYVKEKLQKRLQTAMNQSLKTGRVRKAKFTDFAIQ
jgi:predicted Zn finger-like uncharacterized protein